MAAPPKGGGEPIVGKAQLVEWIEKGCKPKSDWRVGTEHEKFVFRLSDLSRAPYEGPDGIGALLTALADRFDWQPVAENGNVIALTRGAASITLEPGGQFELSGAPLATIHETCREVNQHLAEMRTVCSDLGLGMLGMGFDPKWPREAVPWMPKGRYRIMRNYMPKVGSLGLDMMLRTCTVQSNLDFADEADMVRKFRVSLALQPVITALFADSPFLEGKPSGFYSLRSQVWTDTDPDRCGIVDFVFEDGFGFERYVDYLLDVPMYFAYRDGGYIDLAGRSFRDFMAGELEAEDMGRVIRRGEIPHMGDWSDHVTTAFPEVRLKRYLEMRGADGGPWRRLCALSAFWVGILYDTTALDAAWDLVKDWTAEERAELRAGVPRRGLGTPFRDGKLLDVAARAVAIARAGLGARACLDGAGNDESGFLDALEEVVASGDSPAAEKLALFQGRWGGSVDPVFREFAY